MSIITVKPIRTHEIEMSDVLTIGYAVIALAQARQVSIAEILQAATERLVERDRGLS